MEPTAVFEIIAIDKQQLVLTKQSGTWRYDLKPSDPLTQAIREELEKRQQQGQKVIGRAVFLRTPRFRMAELWL